MSRVKKAVLFILIVISFMLILLTNANAGSAKIGGVFVNSESATVTACFTRNNGNKANGNKHLKVIVISTRRKMMLKHCNEVFVNTKANYTFPSTLCFCCGTIRLR